MSFSKTLYPLLSAGSIQGMSCHDLKNVDWDVKHRHKQKILQWLFYQPFCIQTFKAMHNRNLEDISEIDFNCAHKGKWVI